VRFPCANYAPCVRTLCAQRPQIVRMTCAQRGAQTAAVRYHCADHVHNESKCLKNDKHRRIRMIEAKKGEIDRGFGWKPDTQTCMEMASATGQHHVPVPDMYMHMRANPYTCANTYTVYDCIKTQAHICTRIQIARTHTLSHIHIYTHHTHQKHIHTHMCIHR
jgi:hypothetical protein